MMRRKIIIAGGTGQIGQILARHFVLQGDEVVILTRSKGADAQARNTGQTVPGRQEEPPEARRVLWDGRSPGEWCAELEGAEVVLNLAGRSVNCRYTPENRRLIKDSRVDSTHAIGAAITAAAHPPKLWLQASTATLYSHRFDAPNDETTGHLDPASPDSPDTWRFSIDVGRAWEAAAHEAGPLPHTRRVLMRTSIVMSPDAGGAFDTLLALVRHGLGGTSGNGRQYVSWLHDADLTAAIEHLIASDTLKGPVILASPQPLPNAEFMRELRRAWGISLGLPAPAWLLEIGAFFMRTESELVLKSRRVVPGRLLADGFTFRFPRWHEAARDLCQRWRQHRYPAAARKK